MSGSGQFCGGCGQELKQGARFCGVCGHSAPENSQQTGLTDEEGLPTPTHHVTASRSRAAAPQPFNLTPPARESAESSERSFDEVGSSPRRASGPPSPALDGTGPRVVHQRRPRWPIALGLVLLLALGVTAAIYLLAFRSHTIVSSGHKKSQEATSTPSSSTSSPETTTAPAAPGSDPWSVAVAYTNDVNTPGGNSAAWNLLGPSVQAGWKSNYNTFVAWADPTSFRNVNEVSESGDTVTFTFDLHNGTYGTSVPYTATYTVDSGIITSSSAVKGH